MISANAYVFARVMLSATLTHQNVTSFSKLATEYFYAKTFAV